MSAALRHRILGSGGVLLILLGVLHLAVTPVIARFVVQSTRPASTHWLLPPMLLNHVVVGLLLLPLGATTLYAAGPASRGERWAVVVTRITALSVATLPVSLFALMGRQYFAAVPFLVATVIVCLAAATLLAAAFWPSSQGTLERGSKRP
jgi:hypothetical protein